MIVDSLTFSPAGMGFAVRIDRLSYASNVGTSTTYRAVLSTIEDRLVDCAGRTVDDAIAAMLARLRELPGTIEAECGTIARAAAAAWPEGAQP